MTDDQRILVVDDEPLNVELLRQELADLGYGVDIATDGQEALDAVAASPPDLILLDVVMPRLDGIEVCRRLKGDPATQLIPIVIMTALSDHEDRLRGVEAGADDFLTKPVDHRELHARIRTALRSKLAIDRKLDELTSAAEQIAALGAHDEDVAVVATGPGIDIEHFTQLIERAGGNRADGPGTVVAVFRGVEPAERIREAMTAAVSAQAAGAGIGVAVGSVLIGATQVVTERGPQWVTKVDGDVVADAVLAAGSAAPGEVMATRAVVEQLGGGYRASPSEGRADLFHVGASDDDVDGSDELAFPSEFSDLLPVLRLEWSITDLYVTRLLAGKSGAKVLAVDIVCRDFSGQAILKLEMLEDEPDVDVEANRHQRAVTRNEAYASAHLSRVVKALRHGDATATLSTVAAGGLEYCTAWFHAPYELQLDSARTVTDDLMNRWNEGYELAPGLVGPQDVLASWLRYRLDPAAGGRIDDAYRDLLGLDPEARTLLVEGEWYPNPLVFARPGSEGAAGPPLRAVVGQVHGDLHGHNLLISHRRSDVAAYYLIDLAFWEERNFLFFDQAYFELSYLLRVRGGAALDRWLTLLGAVHGSQPTDADDVGILRIVETIREAERSWIQSRETHRTSFMESQMLLARIGAGLNWVHKRVDPELKLQALLYAAVALKEYLHLHDIAWPRNGVVVAWPEGD